MATVTAKLNFDRVEAAEQLVAAMKGLGTDEKQLIVTTVEHSYQQRIAVQESFELKTGKSLEKELKSELSGSFESSMQALFKPPSHLLARAILSELKGAKTDDSVLVEVLGTILNQEVEQVSQAFRLVAQKDLAEAMEKDGSNRIKNYFRLLLDGNSSFFLSGKVLSNEAIEKDALYILQAGEHRFQGDHVFLEVFCARTYAHMAKVIEQLEVLAAQKVEEMIGREAMGKEKDALLALVQVSKGTSEFLARRVNGALKGMMKDSTTLSRIFVSRCEIDLSYIEAAHDRLFEKPLEKMFGKGDFDRLMVALLGKKK